jgi:DNA-directed RNA polymerase specialized sigma24 family protein
VDRSEAISLLPAAYRQALLMRERGLPYEAIAEALTIEPEGVPALIRLAEAKLANLLSRPAGQESTHSDI